MDAGRCENPERIPHQGDRELRRAEDEALRERASPRWRKELRKERELKGRHSNRCAVLAATDEDSRHRRRTHSVYLRSLIRVVLDDPEAPGQVDPYQVWHHALEHLENPRFVLGAPIARPRSRGSPPAGTRRCSRSRDPA